MVDFVVPERHSGCQRIRLMRFEVVWKYKSMVWYVSLNGRTPIFFGGYED